MTGIAVIEHRDSIQFKNIAIDNIAVTDRGLSSFENVTFTLDSKKIKQIQKELKLLGLYKGKISGRSNLALKKSITEYQNNEGFEPTGIITETIYNKLTGIEVITDNQPLLPFTENHSTNNKPTYPNNGLLPFFARPVNQIHISQSPKTKGKENLYTWGGKDDYLFIGVFMILIAVSLIAAFVFA